MTGSSAPLPPRPGVASLPQFRPVLGPAPAPARSRPAVLLTADEQLAAEVLRLAAAAGAPLDVLSDPPVALRRWAAAGAVLVAADLAADLVALHPERRGEVHLVTRDTAGDRLFRAAVDVGASSVIELPEGAGWLMGLLSDLADGAGAEGVLLAVTGGSGGAGASVLACALGLVAGRLGPAALLDLDPWGPGQRRLAGFDDPAPLTGRGRLTWSELAAAPGRLGARALREALGAREGLGILDCGDASLAPPSSQIVREVVAAARRGHDRVIIDVPRPVADGTAEMLPRCDRVLLVVRATLPDVAAAARVAGRLVTEGAPVGVVVRARRRDAGRAAEVARAVGAPLVAELPEHRRLEEHLDLGVGPVFGRRAPLARAASRILAEAIA